MCHHQSCVSLFFCISGLTQKPFCIQCFFCTCGSFGTKSMSVLQQQQQLCLLLCACVCINIYYLTFSCILYLCFYSRLFPLEDDDDDWLAYITYYYHHHHLHITTTLLWVVAPCRLVQKQMFTRCFRGLSILLPPSRSSSSSITPLRKVHTHS